MRIREVTGKFEVLVVCSNTVPCFMVSLILYIGMEDSLINAIQTELLRLGHPLWEKLPHQFICPTFLHGAEVASHVAYGPMPRVMYEAPRSCCIRQASLENYVEAPQIAKKLSPGSPDIH